MTDPTTAGSLGTAVPPSDESGRRAKKERPRSLTGDAIHILIRNPVFIAAALVALAVISMAIFPSWWTSADPLQCPLSDTRLSPGAPSHILGTSSQGCDYYTHAVYGARPSIQVAVFATAGATVLGLILGTIAGYFGGWVDAIISRLVDIVAGLPFLLGALTLLALLRSRSVWAVAFAIIALAWTLMTRIMRANVLATKNMDYVHAARSLGASNLRIIVRHIIPNAIAPLFVVSTIALGTFIAAEATLTFLGVGLQPPTISWGVMITQGQAYVLSGYPHLLVVPGTFLLVTVLAFLLLGDALRDAFDPKLH